MKKYTFFIAVALLSVASTGFSQEIPQKQVPSLVINNFKKSYPKAKHIEWEKDGDLFKVDFDETANKDLEVWYDETGNPVKYEEEIPKGQLPEKVLSKINSDFKDYEIEEVEKVTENNTVHYKVELDAKKMDLNVIFDPEGEVLSQSGN